VTNAAAGDVQAEINRSYTKHRKIASSFRDTQLFEIFELGINLLKKAYEMIKTVDYNDADQVSAVSVPCHLSSLPSTRRPLSYDCQSIRATCHPSPPLDVL